MVLAWNEILKEGSKSNCTFYYVGVEMTELSLNYEVCGRTTGQEKIKKKSRHLLSLGLM